MFTIDHDKALDTSLIEEGTYEVVVHKAFEDAARTGTMFMNLHLVIRNDIDQKNKNRYIFGSIWQSRETGQYHSGMVNAVAKALRIENGKRFNSLQEMLDDFKFKTARVTVKHEEYNGKTQVRIQKWEQSRFPQSNHQFKTSDVPVDGFTDAGNENIPF